MSLTTRVLIGPGAGLAVGIAVAASGDPGWVRAAAAIEPVEAAGELPSFADWLVSLIPTNPVRAAADGAMLPLSLATIPGRQGRGAADGRKNAISENS